MHMKENVIMLQQLALQCLTSPWSHDTNEDYDVIKIRIDPWRVVGGMVQVK